MTGVAHERVRWAELKLQEFEARLAARPLVYLPMGICEPHGHAAAFGLDLIKADFICDAAAARFGGIVAPSQGYHIHEVGYHAPWIDEVIGPVNPRMAALPPDVVMRSLLFQLRAFVNAGFRSVAVISGHNGAQADLRLVAAEFMKIVPVPVVVRSDPELVDLTRASRANHDPLGRFAQNPDAHEASRAYGEQIIEAMIERVGQLVDRAGVGPTDLPFLSFDDMEPAWSAVEAQRSQWVSYGPVAG